MDEFNEFDVLSVKELAKILRIGTNSAYTLVRNGIVPSIRVGRVYRIPFSSVQEFLANCEGKHQ